MHVAVGPAQVTGNGQGGIDHAVRAARVNVAAERAISQYLADVHARFDAFAVQVHLLAIGRPQLFAEPRMFFAAHCVVQLERHLAQAQLFQLGNHRGNADATSDEQMQACLFDQREQVDRRRDFDQIAFLDAVVQGHRTAATALYPTHGNLVAAGVVGRTQQRVRVAQGVAAIGDQHHHMTATGERRQVLAGR